MSSQVPLAGDFLPLAAAPAPPAAVQASPSYWQHAWARLRADRRATASLVVIAILIIGALAGPWLWRVDPALQRLDEASRPPGLGRSALLVADPEPAAATPCAARATGALTVCATPHTAAVRLAWRPVAGADGYAVYRHELAPRDDEDLGVPLGEVAAPAFEDRLGLEARRYWYSVVPLRAAREAGRAITVGVEPRQAIAWSAALRRGLLPAGAGHERIGTGVQLPAHPLGTDYLGRDILARIIHGARTSLFIGIVAPLLFVLAGLLYGGLSGYLGGRIDNAMMRLADFVVALPFLLFMILFKVAFGIRPGESGVMPMLLAMVLLGWPASARLVRGQVLAIRNEPYVQAARLMGAGTPYLILRHMVPNVLGVLLVTLSFAIPSAIFTEAFLSFIGLGVVPPVPSWGSLCNDGIRSMLAHPHELAVPAAFISITVLAFNLLGDGLRDALDTRTGPA
ncbi:MAG: ABC transporter permease [Pseudomonadales bacterium]|nr:ABC transporter permease [Pseudomonadales bacterium]MBP9034365.1 ABC transporter permease [Pseudomonadales bacterium]